MQANEIGRGLINKLGPGWAIATGTATGGWVGTHGGGACEVMICRKTLTGGDTLSWGAHSAYPKQNSIGIQSRA